MVRILFNAYEVDIPTVNFLGKVLIGLLVKVSRFASIDANVLPIEIDGLLKYAIPTVETNSALYKRNFKSSEIVGAQTDPFCGLNKFPPVYWFEYTT